LNGVPVSWQRDPLDAYALEVNLPKAGATVELDFDYLSPTSRKVGPQEMSREILMLEWIEVVMYPSGYYARQIPVDTTVTLPVGWQFGTALETAKSHGATTDFKRVPLETLVDSPLFAGHYAARFELDPGAKVPVRLNVFADRPEFLKATPEQIEKHRALVQQAYKLYGAHHYDHYDFLLSLSDEVRGIGLEHHQSSEDGTPAAYFTDWEKSTDSRELLPHEYTHSWNGKFRRPADLWTPNYHVPMQDSLLWVYEGQTQYWGHVLSARSGLWTSEQARDALAVTAAYYDHQAGRQWRPLQDTTNDEIINPRNPQSWNNWQRFEDYYSESALIWLDADTLIRERSSGKRSLDDFARAFFGINDGSYTPATYTFADVVKTLNQVEPYDWAGFLRAHLDRTGAPAPLEGLKRGGYRLVYTAEPNTFMKDADGVQKRAGFLYSLGISVSDKDGEITEVYWDSPAFHAKLTEGMEILAVNRKAYSASYLEDVLKSAQASKQPIELIVRQGEHYSVVSIPYFDGPRYPHLERDGATPARLDAIFAAKP
jgi:predicted metalloprotease with PDZ domain